MIDFTLNNEELTLNTISTAERLVQDDFDVLLELGFSKAFVESLGTEGTYEDLKLLNKLQE